MKTIVFLLILASAAHAQQPFTANGAVFALSVPNVAETSRWYQERFGLKVVMNVTAEGERPAVVVLQGNGLVVELQQHAAATPVDRSPTSHHGIFKVGFTVKNLDAAIAELKARGVEIVMGPFPKRPDQPANVIIRDNAGTYIQLIEN